MPDIIKLLPDSVANQIAAGEVIQRPASVVKELMENAIDAHAENIKLIIKDAGRTLIQVIDNGDGMSETDARLSFERHATSKIKQANDLFSISTMGFRGEALASICAIARVEMKSRRETDELGTYIINEASVVKSQEACSCDKGTSIAVKNLFFNVPARRNFLKSDQVELKHINDEFIRLAIAHPHIAFSYYHNNSEVFHLEKTNLKKRLVACFGNAYNERLVALEHTSELVSFRGFISKPEFARKTRGEQFFFTNNRFMKHNYLNHAVVSAFANLIKSDSFPSYFIFIEIAPEQIDVNIHPTKTEIKFQDERIVYSFLNATVKRALGVHNIMPSIDFTKPEGIDVTPLPQGTFVAPPVIKTNPNFNPFERSASSHPFESPTERSNKRNWQKLYDEYLNKNALSGNEKTERSEKMFSENIEDKFSVLDTLKMIQLHNRFIIASVKSGIMLIDQQAAHERILFEKYLHCLENNKPASQQLLFPQTITFSNADAEIVSDLHVCFIALGFGIVAYDKNTFEINATPADLTEVNLQDIFEKMLESYKSSMMQVSLNKNEKIATALAKNLAVKQGKPLQNEEMNDIIEKLFACANPNYSPTGKPTVALINLQELEAAFYKKN